MRTPAGWLRAAALSAAAGLLVPAVLVSPASAGALTEDAGSTLSPGLVSTSTELVNPMRGQYTWMGQAPQPDASTAPDRYDRDATYWGRLEKTKGVYDFSTIDAGLRAAGDVNGKYGFRVMAYCPGCWMENNSSLPPVVPPWMPRDSAGAPWWNSEIFLSSWEALWAELGRRYADDPRLGYVDVGGYGKYGEWATPDNLSYVTEANSTRIIDAVAKAFPDKHVLASAVMVYTKPTTLQNALTKHPNLGLRSDCLGKSDWQKPQNGFSSWWQTRPFYTEWCTSGEPVLGLQQAQEYHVSTISSGNRRLAYDDMTSSQKSAYTTLLATSGYRYAVTQATFEPLSPGQPFAVGLTVRNDGTAPTYDRWATRLVLKNGSGSRVATLPLSLDLQDRLPGTSTFTQTLTLPSALAVGTYSAAVEVVDPTKYTAPMRLANTGRASDGSYPLGTVEVGLRQAVEEPVSRISGSDRYAASAAISQDTFDPGVPVAYIATGEKFPDALSGAPAAAALGGPVLLVQPTALPTPTRDELTRLKPKRIVVLGGTGSVSSAVYRDLGRYTSGSVTRVSGADRYAASAAISAKTFPTGVPVAYVATGAKFPDALSGAPAAGVLGGPVLLVQQTAVPAPIADELRRLKPKRIVVLGGTGSVSSAVYRDLGRFTSGSVSRISGSDRYAASAAISHNAFAAGVPVAYVATGAKFPDALSGAPAAGNVGGPVLLVQSTAIPDAIATELSRLKPTKIVVLGGSGSVSTTVQKQLLAYAGGGS